MGAGSFGSLQPSAFRLYLLVPSSWHVQTGRHLHQPPTQPCRHDAGNTPPSNDLRDRRSLPIQLQQRRSCRVWRLSLWFHPGFWSVDRTCEMANDDARRGQAVATHDDDDQDHSGALRGRTALLVAGNEAAQEPTREGRQLV